MLQTDYINCTSPRMGKESRLDLPHWYKRNLLKEKYRISPIEVAREPMLHKLTKNVEVHCHYIWQLVDSREIELQYCVTPDQTTHLFTKPPGTNKFIKFTDRLEFRI